MPIIETYDQIGGCYMDETPGGVFGNRRYYDRRYWCAWESCDDRRTPMLCNAVMDDFGTLVAVPKPPRLPKH